MVVIFLISTSLKVENEDEKIIRTIFDKALTEGESYENLRYLCKEIGHRLTGSPEADKAVLWAKSVMEKCSFDTVYLQEIFAPHWVRGENNSLQLSHLGMSHPVEFTALGGSVPTNGLLQAEVIEINSIEELKERADEVAGKIVFYNIPLDKKLIDPFKAYGGCVGIRYSGASAAAEFGASAVLVRSLTTQTDKHAHTGIMGYKEGVDSIPAVALSTHSSDILHSLLTKGKVTVAMELHCQILPEVKTYNVIGEIRGTLYPDQYMVVGGHLDSWDLGEGAHDDGAGCVQSIEALRLLRSIGYEPRHSMRVVLFMNEESGNAGGKTYAIRAIQNGEQHIFALETDRGGFSPRGFSIDGKEYQIERVRDFSDLLKPYGLYYFEPGFAGVDIFPLKQLSAEGESEIDILLMGLYPDPQRYFDYHHTDQDVFEAVNQRELELGGASMSSMLYLMDTF